MTFVFSNIQKEIPTLGEKYCKKKKKKKDLLNHVKSLAARQTDFIDQNFSIKMIFSRMQYGLLLQYES